MPRLLYITNGKTREEWFCRFNFRRTVLPARQCVAAANTRDSGLLYFSYNDAGFSKSIKPRNAKVGKGTQEGHASMCEARWVFPLWIWSIILVLRAVRPLFLTYPWIYKFLQMYNTSGFPFYNIFFILLQEGVKCPTDLSIFPNLDRIDTCKRMSWGHLICAGTGEPVQYPPIPRIERQYRESLKGTWT